MFAPVKIYNVCVEDRLGAQIWFRVESSRFCSLSFASNTFLFFFFFLRKFLSHFYWYFSFYPVIPVILSLSLTIYYALWEGEGTFRQRGKKRRGKRGAHFLTHTHSFHSLLSSHFSFWSSSSSFLPSFLWSSTTRWKYISTIKYTSSFKYPYHIQSSYITIHHTHTHIFICRSLEKIIFVLDVLQNCSSLEIQFKIARREEEGGKGQNVSIFWELASFFSTIRRSFFRKQWKGRSPSHPYHPHHLHLLIVRVSGSNSYHKFIWFLASLQYCYLRHLLLNIVTFNRTSSYLLIFIWFPWRHWSVTNMKWERDRRWQRR